MKKIQNSYKKSGVNISKSQQIGRSHSKIDKKKCQKKPINLYLTVI